jgi:transcriptional regulator of arginine metabolism
MNKEKRLNAIRKIITNQKIRSQEELLRKLIDLGFELTQATLSRDLKYLKVGRIPSENGFTYVISNEFVKTSIEFANSPVIVGFQSLEFSGNMAVIKTLPAYSHTVADALDKAEIHEILGTVAGNDTVIVVIREGFNRKQVIKAIVKSLPELNEKLS